MQKIYVLLRNDRQTGPYSLEEIIQFDLKPYDLIWIEGKSAGWYYPQEITALHPYLAFLPQKPKPAALQTTAARNVFVTMPSTATPEEPQTVSLPETPAYPPKEMFVQPAPGSKNLEEEVQSFFTQPAKEATPAATTTALPKQKKSSSISVGGGIAAVLIVGGVFAASWIMNRHSNEENVVADLPATAPVSEVSTAAAAKNDNTASLPSQTLRKQKQQKSSTSARQTKTTANQQATRAGNKNVVVNNPGEEATDYGTAAPAEEKPPVSAKEETAKAPAETTAPQEKKKTLREKFLDLFKKKPDAQKGEETTPTENGERTSTHREADANLAQLVHVRFDVPNDWMMGIKGAKATLVNRSNQTVSKATVEVLYYDDDDQLLQKKVVTFGKIDSKESQTLSIPDHATATKVDYNIVSVVGKPAA